MNSSQVGYLRLLAAGFLSPLPALIFIWVPDLIAGEFNREPIRMAAALTYGVAAILIFVIGMPIHAALVHVNKTALRWYLLAATSVWLVFAFAMDLPSFIKPESVITSDEWLKWGASNASILMGSLLTTAVAYFIRWPERWTLFRRPSRTAE